MPTPLRKRKEAAWELLTGDLFAPPFGASVPGGDLTYAEYVAALNPLLWLQLRETSGTTPANSGRATGLTIAWTPGTGAVGQTGQLGPDEAYSYDGASSKIQIVNDAPLASLATMTTQKWGFLVKLATLGESNLGHLMSWGSGAGGANQNYLAVQATNKLNVKINLSTTDCDAVANNNQIFDIIGSGNFAWIFMDYDDAGTRKMRLFKGLGGAVTQLTLATDTAGVGTIVNMTNPLALGNNAASPGGFTIDGVADEYIADDSLWTAAQMQNIVTLTGV